MKISNLSNCCIILLFCLVFPSINKSSANCFFNGSFCFGGIKISSFCSILFSGLGVLNIFILSTVWILLSGLKFPSIIIESTTWPLNDSFSFSSGLINILPFSSITLSGLGVLNMSILSTFWISLVVLKIPSMNSSSTNCLFNGSFALDSINKLSFCSIIIFGFDFEVLMISMLSTFCIKLSSLPIPKILILSINCCFKDSFCFGAINIVSFSCILFCGFAVLNISILSTFCISLSIRVIPSTIILSIIWHLKGSFIFAGIKMLSFNSMIFSGFLLLLIILISSINCITLLSLIFPSIKILSTIWFFNGSLTLGAINKLSFSSMTFLGLRPLLNISTLSTFCILLSGRIVFSIVKSSTNCFIKGSFSFGRINKLWFVSIIFLGLGVLNISILSTVCILLSGL